MYWAPGAGDHSIVCLNFEQNRVNDYPSLSKMARDYLAIPASSVAVERKFSSGVGIITAKRASLNRDTFQMLHEMKEFLKFGGKQLFEMYLAENPSV